MQTAPAEKPPSRNPQLHMVWPVRQRLTPPPACEPAGYRIRLQQPEDEMEILDTMASAGWPTWKDDSLPKARGRVLKDGWFVVVCRSTRQVVATAMAQRDRNEFGQPGGELGWVACRSEHSGKGLGSLVCTAVTQRLLDEGFHHVHLYTDDWRLPAIKTYLKLGYAPWLEHPGDQDRWHQVFEHLELG